MIKDRPKVLDLFCGAGGASKGYHDAGFEIIGVDITPQPRYPYRFIQADAMEVLADDSCWQCLGIWPVDLVHASPPCQRGSRMTNCRPGLAATYPDLVAPVRKHLAATGLPYVIEQPQHGTPLINPVMLCGAMFGRELYRHRMFESNVPLTAPPHPRHVKPASKAGHWVPGTVISVAGNCAPVALAREMMAIDWTNRDELGEAIPPYFAQHIGAQVMAVLRTAA